jgi:hypothetical protein
MLRFFILPTGKYHPQYLNYIKWSFTSNVLISMEQAMATHSMLHAINVDNQSLQTASYIGKDIIGQLGGLIYASKMGQTADEQPKKFLMYSNIVEQTGMLAQCVTPLVPYYFLPLAGTANIFSNVSFMGYGAMNAKCIQNMALDNNLGELYTKITMINMIGSSVGLVLGVGVTMMIPEHDIRLPLVPIIGMARVYSFNRAMDKIIL